jgi:hypothetical protein
LTEATPTRIYFRVADVYRDKRVVVTAGDEVLYDKKKQKLAPGEMETVELSAEAIKRAAELGATIKFEIV